MTIEVIRTGSAGNLIKLADPVTSILIEAGFKINTIKQLLDFNLSEINGVIISHEHCDHAVGVKGLIKAGKNTFMSEGTKQALNLTDSYNLYTFHKSDDAYKKVVIGSLEVTPFEVYHDAAEPVGFVIYSTITKERLLFATDTGALPYNFPILHYILLEINYSEKVLRELYDQGKVNLSHYKKVRETHLSEDNAIEFLKRQDLSYVKEFYAIHRSEKHSSDNLLDKLKPIFSKETILEV